MYFDHKNYIKNNLFLNSNIKNNEGAEDSVKGREDSRNQNLILHGFMIEMLNLYIR